jgi:hypothetical protein
MERAVRSACGRGSYATFVKVSHRMGDQDLSSRASPFFGWHVKLLVPAAFVVLITH